MLLGNPSCSGARRNCDGKFRDRWGRNKPRRCEIGERGARSPGQIVMGGSDRQKLHS